MSPSQHVWDVIVVQYSVRCLIYTTLVPVYRTETLPLLGSSEGPSPPLTRLLPVSSLPTRAVHLSHTFPSLHTSTHVATTPVLTSHTPPLPCHHPSFSPDCLWSVGTRVVGTVDLRRGEGVPPLDPLRNNSLTIHLSPSPQTVPDDTSTGRRLRRPPDLQGLTGVRDLGGTTLSRREVEMTTDVSDVVTPFEFLGSSETVNVYCPRVKFDRITSVLFS